MERLSSAFIIFLYLLTVHFYFLTVIAFETSKIRFSKRLDGYNRSAVYTVPLKSCWTACKERSFCKSVNYQRQLHKCEMNTANLNEFLFVSLSQTKGWVYYEDTDEESCGNQAFGTQQAISCPVKECSPLVIENGYVKGNMVKIGSKVKIGCNEGFMSTSGPNIEVISECSISGTFETITCFPVTCIKVAESSFINRLNSASYTSFDVNSGQNVNIFCDFDPDTSLGYTYFSKSTLRHVTSLANHYNVYDHVIVRHHDVDVSVQYSSRLQMLSTYLTRHPNVSVFLSSHTGFTSPTVSNGAYIYLGFVPGIAKSDHIPGGMYGYSCNGNDKLFRNCDGNPNNYLVIHENRDGSIQARGCCAGGIAVAWKDCKQLVDGPRIMAEEYFYDTFEMHMGGCGTLAISNMEGVHGVSFGLPFNY